MRKNDQDPKPKDDRMKRALTVSGLFHLAIIIVAIVGLPYITSRELTTPTMIAVELAEVSDAPTTNRTPQEAPRPKEETKPKPKPEPKKPTPPKVVEPVKTKPPPEDDLAPPKPEKKPEPKPKPEKKPEPKIEKKPEPTPTEDKQSEQFDSLLKNLVETEPQASETDPDATKEAKASPAPAPQAPLSDRLSASEFDALRNQLASCWNVMAGAAESENLVVDIDVVVGPDRIVQSAVVADQGRYTSDSFFRAAADSALRALKNPRCSPLLLPPEKYNLWKSMTISFDPKDMLI